MFSIVNAQLFMPSAVKKIMLTGDGDHDRHDYLVEYASYYLMLYLFISQTAIPWFSVSVEEAYEERIDITSSVAEKGSYEFTIKFVKYVSLFTLFIFNLSLV